MFKHEKMLLKEVKIDRPNPNYAAMLQEQLGGPQGELKAALQYLSQSMRVKDKQIKDLFLDVAAEELCHFENCTKYCKFQILCVFLEIILFLFKRR